MREIDQIRNRRRLKFPKRGCNKYTSKDNNFNSRGYVNQEFIDTIVEHIGDELYKYHSLLVSKSGRDLISKEYIDKVYKAFNLTVDLKDKPIKENIQDYNLLNRLLKDIYNIVKGFSIDIPKAYSIVNVINNKREYLQEALI